MELTVQFLTIKFFFAILPLVVLGHIFGLLLTAFLSGWHVNPLVLLLNGVGIQFAIWECQARLTKRA
jgi:hypothetical protein